MRRADGSMSNKDARAIRAAGLVPECDRPIPVMPTKSEMLHLLRRDSGAGFHINVLHKAWTRDLNGRVTRPGDSVTIANGSITYSTD